MTIGSGGSGGNGGPNTSDGSDGSDSLIGSPVSKTSTGGGGGGLGFNITGFVYSNDGRDGGSGGGGGGGIARPAGGTSSGNPKHCLLYTSPSPRDGLLSRMPSSA